MRLIRVALRWERDPIVYHKYFHFYPSTIHAAAINWGSWVAHLGNNSLKRLAPRGTAGPHVESPWSERVRNSGNAGLGISRDSVARPRCD